MAKNDKPASESGTPAQTELPMRVRVKVARGHSVVTGKRPASGFYGKAHGPGTIIDLTPDEAARLKKRGIVIDADAELPKRPEGVAVQSAEGPRAQGPDFSRRP